MGGMKKNLRGLSLVVVGLVVALLGSFGSGEKIQIVHWGDVSGQIESFVRGSSDSSAAPTPCPGGNDGSNCIGGVVRLAHHIAKESKVDSDQIPLSVRLSSGNLIGGESGWISSIGWKPYAEFVKDHFKPDVLALGMKEFGAGVARTVDYMDAITGGGGANNSSKIVLANSCLGRAAGAPESTFCGKIAKMTTIGAGSEKIGVIGFVTPTVERLSLPGKLKFEEVSKAIQEVVAANSGIKTFIALGDGTLDMAKKILDDVSKVKLVIYGAGLGNTKDMTGDYPMTYNGRLIATAGRYGSSIGKLVLDWDTSSGELKKDSSSKLIETTTEPYNEEGNAANSIFTTKFLGAVLTERNITLGYSRVKLEGGEICWRGECNLGNLVTDAMVRCALVAAPLEKPYPYPIHAIWHGGAFFEDVVKPGGKISKFDVHRWLPYHNRAHLVKVSGSNLKKLFQESAKGIDPDKAGVKDWRQFLQVSNGMEVQFRDTSLVKIRMTHDQDGVPMMSDIQDHLEYYLVIPTYLYEGRGVYEFAAASDFWSDVTHEGVNSNFAFDDDCVADYIFAVQQISVGFEERIWINGSPGSGGSGSGGGTKSCKTWLTVLLTIVFFVIFLAIGYVGYFYVLPRLRRTSTTHVEYPPNQL